jgi:hypothetical protein
MLGLESRRALSVDDTRRIRDSMSVNSVFWNTLADPSAGFDGSQWILESKIGDDYHFVDRWTPREGAAHDMGLQFIAISGADFGEVY